MRLYVLINYFRDIGDDISGVFDSEEKAIRAAKELDLNEDDYQINEYELNEIDYEK